MATITVVRAAETTYRVTVEERGTRTIHDVRVTPEDVQRYAPPGVTPEKLVDASFQFLLAREPKESILRRFDLPVIEKYFPEYPRVIRATGGSAHE
jgi:hypothetical protein